MMPLLLALLAAQVPDAPTAPRPLRWDPAIDVPATFLMTGFWLVTETGLKDNLAPTTCHWCGTNSVDLAVRKGFVGSGTTNHGAEDAASNVAVALAPVVMGGLDALLVREGGGTWRDWSTDFLLMAEATAAAMSLNQVVKFSVGRERPLIWALSAEEKAARTDNDGNLSFFSGHTTLAASLAAAAGTIAWLRGHRHAWVVWLVGGAIAVSTGLLRIGADKHWFSDVLTGLVIGAGVGVGVPLLFHGKATPLSVAFGPNGAVVSVRF